MKSGQGGPSGRIILADNLPVLREMEEESVQLVYVDPPFNTGRAQARTRIRVERDKEGDRTGFQGARYRTTILGRSSYDDRHPDYLAFHNTSQFTLRDLRARVGRSPLCPAS